MHLDRVFRALGDPTRRAVLSRLSAGPAAVSELARASDMALPSFAQHLDVLEQSGLVRSRKVGRVRTYRLEVWLGICLTNKCISTGSFARWAIPRGAPC